MSRPEALLERTVLRSLGADPSVALFKNEIGEGYYGCIAPMLRQIVAPLGLDAYAKITNILYRNRVTYGLHVGASDLIAIVGPHGRLAAIELKSEHGQLRPEQRTFIERMRSLGAVAGTARSVEEAAALVHEARSLRSQPGEAARGEL